MIKKEIRSTFRSELKGAAVFATHLDPAIQTSLKKCSKFHDANC